jgi:transposase
MSTLEQLREVAEARTKNRALLRTLVKKAYAEGQPIRQIALAGGVTRSTVYAILKEETR